MSLTSYSWKMELGNIIVRAWFVGICTVLLVITFVLNYPKEMTVLLFDGPIYPDIDLISILIVCTPIVFVCASPLLLLFNWGPCTWWPSMSQYWLRFNYTHLCIILTHKCTQIFFVCVSLLLLFLRREPRTQYALILWDWTNRVVYRLCTVLHPLFVHQLSHAERRNFIEYGPCNSQCKITFKKSNFQET